MTTLRPPKESERTNGGSTLAERFRARFGRITTSGRLIPEIDGLRFPAIAIVVIGHLSSFFLVRGGYGVPTTSIDRAFAAPERFAVEGVYLFFVISGFILALPFANHYRANAKRVDLRKYFLRRITRLEPPYLVSLTALVCLEILAAQHHVAGRTGTPGEILGHYFASAAYLHSIIFGTASTVNPPAWSLEVEVQFYILVPILTTCFAVRSAWLRRVGILAMAAVAIGFQLSTPGHDPRVSLSLAGSLQYFLAGFLLADVYLCMPGMTAPRSYLWDAVAVVGWPVVFFLWLKGSATTVLLPWVMLVVFIAAFRGRLTNKFFTNAWVTTLGGMCYSIYLVHFEMVAAVGRAVRHVLRPTGTMWLDMVIEGPIILAVTLCACIAFYAAIERPCMDPAWPAKASTHVRARLRALQRRRFLPAAWSD